MNQKLLQSGTCDPLCSVDEISSQDFEASYQPKTDLLKALAIIASATAGAVAINHSWVAANQVHPCSVSSPFVCIVKLLLLDCVFWDLISSIVFKVSD